MFPRLPARAIFVADTKFVSETQKMFLIFVRNILCPQQMFPRLRGMGTKQMFCVPLVCPPKKRHEQQCVGNNVSSFATTFMHFHFKSIRISFINKVTRIDKAMIVANDTSLCGSILVLFLEFRPSHRAEVSHMNRRQNSSR